MTEKQIPDQPGWKDNPDCRGYWWFQPVLTQGLFLRKILEHADNLWVEIGGLLIGIEELDGRWFGPVEIPEPPCD